MAELLAAKGIWTNRVKNLIKRRLSRMKKLFKSLIALTLCLSMLWGCVPCVRRGKNYRLARRKGELVFSDQLPVLVEDRTLVPMRAIFEAMGAVVFWDKYDDSVVAVKRYRYGRTLDWENRSEKERAKRDARRPGTAYQRPDDGTARFVGEGRLARRSTGLVTRTRSTLKCLKSPLWRRKRTTKSSPPCRRGKCLQTAKTVLAANISGGALMVKKGNCEASAICRLKRHCGCRRLRNRIMRITFK